MLRTYRRLCQKLVKVIIVRFASLDLHLGILKVVGAVETVVWLLEVLTFLNKAGCRNGWDQNRDMVTCKLNGHDSFPRDLLVICPT